MASGRPKVAESPLELLNTPQLEPGVLNRFFFPACGGSIGFFAGIVGNWASQRPVWSGKTDYIIFRLCFFLLGAPFLGVQKHILLTVAGVALGFYLEDRKSKRVAERDAVYRHYVQLHPEDFPPYGKLLRVFN